MGRVALAAAPAAALGCGLTIPGEARLSSEQIILFALLACVFGLLIWGRWRYDLVAFSALLVGLVTGVVPAEAAFSGFGHPATVIIAMVLIVSRGLSNSGAIDMLARRLGDASAAIGQRVRDLDATAEDQEAVILGLIRNGQRLPGMARRFEIMAGDVLVVQASPNAIDKLVGALGLHYAGQEKGKGTLDGPDIGLMEVVVPQGARIERQSARELHLLWRHGVNLLGVSRQGTRFRERVGRLQIQAGDILLLLGPTERLPEVATWLGCLPLAERGLQVVQWDKAGLAIGIFAGAIALASFGLLELAVALACVAALYVLFNILPLRQVYDAVEWPVIVLLGAMIPIGQALESSGATGTIGAAVAGLSTSPLIVLSLLMVVTMTLSDMMNNTATAVIAAPVAIDIAGRLEVSPDPFLMAVAVASSCAFLTPIGHKNNTLILGPGGYRFGDYWRIGLPLEVLIVLVGIPMILLVWPL